MQNAPLVQHRLGHVYIDTSVIGSCFDTEFFSWSKGLMQDFRLENFLLVLSEVVAGEISSAPEAVRAQYPKLLRVGGELLAINDQALDLAVVYEAPGILALRFRNDMLHIALATVAGVDVLLSWNFRHVVRLEKIRLFKAVHLERGYKPIQIYSPREVTSDDTDEHQSG